MFDLKFDPTIVRVKSVRGGEIPDSSRGLLSLVTARTGIIERVCLWLAEHWGAEFLRPATPLGNLIDVCSISECPPTYDTSLRRDLERIDQSRLAQEKYIEEYEGSPQSPEFPVRWQIASATGLPGFVNGSIATMPRDILTPAQTVEEIGDNWLWKDSPTTPRFLFGAQTQTDIQRVQAELRFYDYLYAGYENRERSLGGENDAPVSINQIAYGFYQQFYQNEIPIYGAGVTVRINIPAQRISVSNAYLPLPKAGDLDDQRDNLSYPQNWPDAQRRGIEAAKRSLAAYELFRGADAIGLYLNLLAAKNTASEAEVGKDGWQWGIFEQLLTDLAYLAKADRSFSDSVDILVGIKDQITGVGDPVWQQALDFIQERFQAQAWRDGEQIAIAPYKGSDLFVFPFAGGFRMAFRVEMSTLDGNITWRVFVDANSAEVLGPPDSVAAHNQFFPTQRARLDNTPSQLTDAELAELDTDLATICLFRRSDKIANQTLLKVIESYNTSPPLPQPGEPVAMAMTQAITETVNVAYHTRELFRYFTDKCKQDRNRLQLQGVAPSINGLRINLGLRGTTLRMLFNPGQSSGLKSVSFQTDTGAGLSVDASGDGRRVFFPSLDPELVYHELAHGFMWLLHSSLFDMPEAQVPFARALLEGYATYFAHSLADQPVPSPSPQDAEDHIFARSAYPVSVIENGTAKDVWGNEWSLWRSKSEAGEDILTFPDLYPPERLDGLNTYRVGMIWARALWAIRRAIGDPVTADRIILDAYPSVFGWAASYELAAEALINSAREFEPALPVATIEQIIAIFAERHILRRAGVRCLAHFTITGHLYAGTDRGLWRSMDQGTTWQKVVLPDHPDLKTGVVSLVTTTTLLYLATRQTVVTFDGVQWQTETGWPLDETPICLHAHGEQVFAGTSQMVRLHQGGVWTPVGASLAQAVLGLSVLDLPDLLTGVPKTPVYACTLIDILFHLQTADTTWPSSQKLEEHGTTIIHRENDGIYVGTYEGKVFRTTPRQGEIMVHGVEHDDWEVVFDPGALRVTILSLHVLDNQLYMGTDKGLWIGTIAPDRKIQWQPQPFPLQQQPAIISIFPRADRVQLGTATNGIWVLHPAQSPSMQLSVEAINSG